VADEFSTLISNVDELKALVWPTRGMPSSSNSHKEFFLCLLFEPEDEAECVYSEVTLLLISFVTFISAAENMKTFDFSKQAEYVAGL